MVLWCQSFLVGKNEELSRVKDQDMLQVINGIPASPSECTDGFGQATELNISGKKTSCQQFGQANGVWLHLWHDVVSEHNIDMLAHFASKDFQGNTSILCFNHCTLGQLLIATNTANSE